MRKNLMSCAAALETATAPKKPSASARASSDLNVMANPGSRWAEKPTVEFVTPDLQPQAGPAPAASAENHRLAAVDEHAVLDVIADGAGQRQAFDVAPQRDQVVGCLLYTSRCV